MNINDWKQEILRRELRPNPDLTNWDEKTAVDTNGQQVLLAYNGRTAMRQLIREGYCGGSKDFRTKSESKMVRCLQFLALDHDVRIASLPTAPVGTELEIFETSIRTDNPLFCIGYECWDCLERRERGDGVDFDILGEIDCLLDTMISDLPRYAAWETGEVATSRRGLWRILARLAKEVLRLRGYPQDHPHIALDEFITVGRWVPKTAV